MSRVGNAIRRINKTIDSRIIKTLKKYNFTPFGDDASQMAGRDDRQRPVFERQISPEKIENLVEKQSLVNNAAEEKVNQAFRRGFGDWEKEYEAKCPNCGDEFNSLSPFVEQLGDAADDVIDEDDVDLESPRLCPTCGELVVMLFPDADEIDRAEEFFQRANKRDNADELLSPKQTSVSQTFLEVCREVAWDIQTFDNGWMLFERSYAIDSDGTVVDWDFEGVYRAPPKLMRYSIGDDGRMGGEYWVCLECRTRKDDYSPQTKPGRCEECGNRTYEVYAYALDGVNGSPEFFYVNGEFAHASEYRPSRFYGLPPVVSLIDEAHALQRMDKWYREAYSRRRAPRGAITIQSSSVEAVRTWNQSQIQKLNSDSNHIPTFIDDTDGGGQPLTWVSLLENPAEMQNMEMRRWFKDRISAKFGVTAVFQSSRSSSTGMSQSQEILVSNRSAQRLQNVFNETFIPAFLGNLDVTGWTRKMNPPEEEDEQAEEQLRGRKLQNLRTASELGFDVEWTDEGEAIIHPERVEAGGGEEEGEGGSPLGGLFGSSPTPADSPVSSSDEEFSNPSNRPTSEDEGIDPAGTTSTEGGRPEDPNERGGEPPTQEKPSTDDPIARSDTAGYSSTTFGGKPGEAISLIEEIEEMEDEESPTEKSVERVRQKYEECLSEANYEMPGFDEIERSVRFSPETGYRAFKRNHSDVWTEYVESDEFVKRVYQFVEGRL